MNNSKIYGDSSRPCKHFFLDQQVDCIRFPREYSPNSSRMLPHVSSKQIILVQSKQMFLLSCFGEQNNKYPKVHLHPIWLILFNTIPMITMYFFDYFCVVIKEISQYLIKNQSHIFVKSCQVLNNKLEYLFTATNLGPFPKVKFLLTKGKTLLW